MHYLAAEREQNLLGTLYNEERRSSRQLASVRGGGRHDHAGGLPLALGRDAPRVETSLHDHTGGVGQ